MPSIFGRTRTTSTPARPGLPPPPSRNLMDEFGRVASRSAGSGGTGTGTGTGTGPPTPSKDTKYSTKPPKKDKDKYGGYIGGFIDETESYEASLRLDEAGFYPFTTLPPVLAASFSSSSSSGAHPGVEDIPYGHLAHKREIVLSLFQMTLLVEDVSTELLSRGLQTPFLFSSQAIDLNPGAVRRLIDSFLGTCLTGGSREKWLEDKKFAGVHELGMVLRWGLARVMRRGERRGVLEFEGYLVWRDEEEAQSYPPTHITHWLSDLPGPLVQPISTLLNLLSMLISHAHTSGLTPSALASLFGPLLFGLSLSSSSSYSEGYGPSPASPHHSPNLSTGTPGAGGGWGATMTSSAGASFHQVHETYLANANAFEHIMLAYVRFKGKTTPGGIPPKLANWVRGYPSMLQSSGGGGGSSWSESGHAGGHAGRIGREDLYKPRKGAKMLRALAVRRNVRVYSSDLVRSCASWSSKSGGVNALVGTREWGRVVPSTSPGGFSPGGIGGDGEEGKKKMEPRYNDVYRKRMNLAANFYPISTPFVVSSAAAAVAAISPSRASLSSPFPFPSSSPFSLSQGSSSLSPHRSHTHTLSPHSHLQSGTRPSRSSTSLSTSFMDSMDENEELRFNSLVDLRWAAFENVGFGDVDGSAGERLTRALKLDLNESARKMLPPQRDPITWADFSELGFLRDPASASAAASEQSHSESTVGAHGGGGGGGGGGTTVGHEHAHGERKMTSDWSLEGALQFDDNLVQGVRENDRVVEDMSKKLKKSSKTLPPFGWDTSPVTSEELVEEGFLACFCDLIYGGGIGWMDRGERFLRSSSWGLVEFKSTPSGSTPSSPQTTIHRAYSATASSSPSPSSNTDPRTSSTLLLFEEFVPAEYRALLVNPKQKSRFPLLPSPLAATLGKGKSKSKAWKQAATLNGVPYVLGQVPTTSTATLLGGRGRKEREREFEGLLDGEKSGMTLRLAADGSRTEGAKGLPDPVENIASLDMSTGTLTGGKGSKQVGGGVGTTRKGVPSPLYVEGEGAGEEDYPRPMDRAPTFPLSIMSTSEAMPRPGEESPGEITPTARKSRFRLGSIGIGTRRKSDKGGRNGHGRRGLTMDDLETIDFETRTTGSFNSDSGGSTPPGNGNAKFSKHERTRSKDDTWVDILVSSSSRRMGGQDATMTGSGSQRRRTADPEMMMSASLDEDPDGPMARGEQRRGGVFEYDHDHDPTPGYEEDEDGGEDEDIQEVDYAPSKQKAALYQHRQGHLPGVGSGSRQDPSDMGDISSEEDDPVKSFPSVPGSSGSSSTKQQRPLPSTPSPARKGPGGVSALIEKYASLDSKSSPGTIVPNIPNPSPSRLPVRSSSKDLPTPGGASTTTTTPAAGSRDLPSPPTEDPEQAQMSNNSFPRPLSGDLTPVQGKVEPDVPESVEDRATLTPSPIGGALRYVHGAPLHNLPEDSEEE